MTDKAGKKTGGRSKGTENKVTKEVREHFASFLHYASPEIQGLWMKLAEDNPKDALAAVKDYAEFVLPKLARTESKQEIEITNISETLAAMDEPTTNEIEGTQE